MPCEVRFIRLPSSKQRLIRASILDNAARRQADTLAYGERRVLELVAANAPLEKTLLAVVRLIEQLHPGVSAAITLLDADAGELSLAAANGLSARVTELLAKLPVGLRSGSCGVAASLGRQVVVRDVASDPLWAELASVAVANGVRACCSTPIITAGDRVHGTLALYFDTVRGPNTEELDLVTRLTQLAGIAIRRKQDETALRDSEARFRALFDNVVDGVYQAAPSGELLSANPALVQMLGLEDGAALGRCNMAEFFVDPKERARLVSELESYGRVRHFEYQLRARSGRVIVVIENSRLVTAADGRPLYFEGTITDITQRKAAERALFNEKERAQVTLQSIGDAVVTTDARGNIEYLNPVAEQLTGWEAREAQGLPIESIISLTRRDDGRSRREPRLALLAGRARRHARGQRRARRARRLGDRDSGLRGADPRPQRPSRRRRDGIPRRAPGAAAAPQARVSREPRPADGVHQSARARGAAVDGARRRQGGARQDGGAALHGSRPIQGRQRHLRPQRRRPAAAAARRRAASARSEDRRARAARRRRVRRAAARSHAGDGAAIAESLREAIAAFRFSWRDNALQVGVSIGIVPVEASSETVATLMSAADVACYVAKDLGRNRIHVYEEGDAAERHQEMQWVARINKALEEERFELYYQPIVPIGGGARALAALRAAAADARRARRDRRADGVHSGRRALQPDAGTRSLGHQPYARDARVPRRSRDDAVYARDQPVRHVAERRALPRFRARRAHGRRRRARARSASRSRRRRRSRTSIA